MTKESDLSGTRTIVRELPGQATAGTADEFVVHVAGTAMKILSVAYIPKAAITHNATNYYTHTLRNRKADASGSATPASRSFVAGDASAFISDAFTLSATASDLLVAKGDVLTSEKLVTASGLAMPGGLLIVSYITQ